MITKNWYNYFKSARGNTVVTKGAMTTDGAAVNCGYSTSQVSVMMEALLMKHTSVVYKTTASGIVLGSGSTPPTVSDYMLDSQITSGLHCSVTTVYNQDGNVTRTITATNTSENDITIAEIGHQCQIYTGDNSTSNSKYVLMDRSLLQAPVTIPVGAVGVISYTVKVNVPE